MAPFKSLLAMLLNPRSTLLPDSTGASTVSVASVLVLGLVVLGALSLPRQLQILSTSLAPVGNPALDAHHAALRSGLVRMILVDRLMPSTTILIAGLCLVLTSESIFALAQDRRAAVVRVVVFGAAPLLLWRTGELMVSWLVTIEPPITPGDAVSLAGAFRVGPALLWWQDKPVPAWLEAVDARFNLVTMWIVGLWALGLRLLSRRWSWSHIGLPLACLAIAGAATWLLGPGFYAMILGRP